MTASSYLVHLEELVEAARRLRCEMRDGDGWKAGWMLLSLVDEWARTRQLMLRYCEYDPSLEQRIQEIAAAFVAVLKRREEGAVDRPAQASAKRVTDRAG